MTNKAAFAPDEIHQIAFEEGQPADNGDGYLFTAEEFDLFVQRLLDHNAHANQSAPADKAPPLIQALHANGDPIAMEATIAQQAQRIADLKAGKGQNAQAETVHVTDEKGRVERVRCDWCERCDGVRPHETRCIDCWPDKSESIVLPERLPEPSWDEFKPMSQEYEAACEGVSKWNECIDEFKELNR